MSALWFWQWDQEADPFNPEYWEALEQQPCRIYDPDLERFAIVDQKHFYACVTMKDTHPERYGGNISRRWYIKPPHPRRKGKKLYFVSNAGWRKGKGVVFLHVFIMKLTKKRKPSKHHKLVNHIDGDEWNCREANLEWATHVKNFLTARINRGKNGRYQ